MFVSQHTLVAVLIRHIVNCEIVVISSVSRDLSMGLRGDILCIRVERASSIAGTNYLFVLIIIMSGRFANVNILFACKGIYLVI